MDIRDEIDPVLTSWMSNSIRPVSPARNPEQYYTTITFDKN